MRSSILLGVLLLGAAVYAKPPAAAHYARHEALLYVVAGRHQKLDAMERFAAKPFVEKCLIRWEEGVDRFEGQKLSGEGVLKMVVKWEKLAKPTEELDQEALRLLNRLPISYGKRFPRGGDINKRERHKASKILVDWLTHDQPHMRKAGIDTLEAMYKTRRLYQPDMAPKDRVDKQKDWKRYIDKEQRR